MAGESDTALTWGAQLAYAPSASWPRQVRRSHGREAAELLSRLLGMPARSLDERPPTPMRAGGRPALSPPGWRGGRVACRCPISLDIWSSWGWTSRLRWDSPLAPPGAQLWWRRRCNGREAARLIELIAAEMGTGCGAITLALAALEPRFSRIYAVDSSPQALAMAREPMGRAIS